MRIKNLIDTIIKFYNSPNKNKKIYYKLKKIALNPSKNLFIDFNIEIFFQINKRKSTIRNNKSFNR